MVESSWLIPIIPLAGFLVVGFGTRRVPRLSGWLAVTFVGAALALSLGVAIEYLPGHTKPFEVERDWIVYGSATPQPVKLSMGILVDNLTALMLVVVGVVGFLVALYSVGYMAHDPGRPRYFATICLFVGVMLGLVLANNYLLVFIFWELVGLCSYLLIGFWYQKPSAAAAAKKAFLVTRVGDILLLLGIILLFHEFNTFNFKSLMSLHLEPEAASRLTLPLLLVFGGAVGKSAQVPLHVWLPDAMEGPTPVSALIHAATMVKAGVYLVARSFPLFEQSPDALLWVATIGAVTALLAASLGLVAWDIKRVLAYSTVSQLGYMMLALGVGAYGAAMFHLWNHAFFKALLFLCAGSVIHAVGTNDLRLMGGLRKLMPITSLTMLIGALSLSGIPGLSGFFSKDEILAAALSKNPLLFAMVLLAALFTAFYMFRLWYLAFGRSYRGAAAHPHESPATMTLPLLVLAILAVVSGYWLFAGFGGFINGALPERLLHGEEHVSINPLVAGASILAALLGILVARAAYSTGKLKPETFTAGPVRAGLHRALVGKLGFDRAYYAFAERGVYGYAAGQGWFDRRVVDGVVNGIGRGTVGLSRGTDWTDMKVIDGVINGVARATVGLGGRLKHLQSGVVSHYGVLVIAGVALLLAIAWAVG
ncbi:MAG: NADH-quinone oxidoreductase subunit L [Euryarchaeota archaeon]|nr:NADH-quinone oxidoreductase subunit L [Euryarchaeota archaeon]